MPTDAYVRFGEDPSSIDEERGDAWPLIMGDSTDYLHVNWCELRDTNFGVKFPHSEETADDKVPQQELDKITLKKRVDWASTRLFLQCILAGKASIEKDKDSQNQGVIGKVLVEVCKDVGEEDKLVYLAFEYSKVRILDYAIDMSDPEPSETVTFKYDSFRMGYHKTDPETGLPKGQIEWTTDIADTTATAPASSGSGSDSGNPQSVAAISTLLTAQGATQSSASSSNGNGSAGGGITTATDAAAGANFPGLWGSSGLGVLPD